MNHTKHASMPDMTTSKIVNITTVDHRGITDTHTLNETPGRHIAGVIVRYMLDDEFEGDLKMLFNTTYTKLELTVVDINNDGKETTVSLTCDKGSTLVGTVTCGNNKAIITETLSGMSYYDGLSQMFSSVTASNVTDGEVVMTVVMDVCKFISTKPVHMSVFDIFEDIQDLSATGDSILSTEIRSLIHLAAIISLGTSALQSTNATIIILDKDMSDYIDFDKVEELLNGTVNLLILK